MRLRGVWIAAGVSLVTATAAASWYLYDPRAASQRHAERGDRFFDQNKIEEAILEYRNTVELDPQSGRTYQRLGQAYIRRGDIGGASGSFRRAADVLENDLRAQLVAGRYALLAGQFEEARARAERALALDPDNVETQTLLANALAGLGQLDEAVAAMQRIVDVNPLSASTLNNLGVLALANGQPSEASEAFEQAEEISGGRPAGLPSGAGARAGAPMPFGGGPGAIADVPAPGPQPATDVGHPDSGYVIDIGTDLGDGDTPAAQSPVLIIANPGGHHDVEFRAYNPGTGEEIVVGGDRYGIGSSPDQPVTPVPEPSTWLLLGTALIILMLSRRKTTFLG